MAKFKGIITALVTPFMQDGSVFDLGIINQIKYLNQHGINNVFVCGSYGSFPLMDSAERKRVAEIAVDTCKSLDMKCIVHIGCASTKEAVYLAKHAESIGADAISSVVPYYYSGSSYTEEDYLNYFFNLFNSVSIDIHAYNNPKTTQFDISPKFLEVLIRMGLKGIKDGGSDMGRKLEMLQVIGNSGYSDFDYYPSSTASLITGFLLGAKSCISGVSLSCPDHIVYIYNNIMEGDIAEALEIWKQVMKIRSILATYGSRAVAAYKVLEWRGVYVGIPRQPWINLSDAQKEVLTQRLIGAGINERFLEIN